MPEAVTPEQVFSQPQNDFTVPDCIFLSVGGCPVHCKTFNIIFGLYPPDSVLHILPHSLSCPPPKRQTQMSPDIAK